MRTLPLLCFSLVAGIPLLARADVERTTGVGGAITLSGVAGPSVTHPIGRLTLNATLGLSLSKPDNVPASFGLRGALGAQLALITDEKAELSLGGRVVFGVFHTGGTGGIEGTSGETDGAFGVEIPLRVEWFFAEHVSLHGEVGAVLDVVRSERDGAAFSLGTSHLGAGAGATFHF
jgi:hypothetical protein